MKPGEVAVAEADLPQHGSVDIDQVDHAIRQPGFFQDAHKELGREYLRIGRLPDDGIAAKRRRGRQVAADGGEIEGCDGQDKTFQWPPFGTVMNTRAADGLDLVDLAQEMNVPPEEVDELAGAVDLCLEGILALPEHRRAVDIRPVFGREEVGGLQKDTGPVLPA